jgi:CheY-like chemotaxis protein
VSRITRGGIELHKEDVDLRAVITTAIEATAPVLAERTEPVITNVANDSLTVRGDSDRLQQVLVNLISNAARYSPSDTPIWLSAAVEGNMIVLRVKDVGRGIPQHMLREIFELFVQNEQGLERSKGGLGIGLTLVRKIVELHGGTVEARSTGPGTGSEFIVKLPRQPDAIPKGESRGTNHDSGKKRILVVEDQDDSREMMCCLFSLKGHIVMEASDGMGAVDAIETQHPDIAFVDIGLPILNGYEVAQKIRANPVLDDVVLVALTGYGRDQDIEAAKAAGFDEHLAKPADTSQLDAIVAKWSSARRTSR